jgi:hypothetical protein
MISTVAQPHRPSPDAPATFLAFEHWQLLVRICWEFRALVCQPPVGEVAARRLQPGMQGGEAGAQEAHV